MLRSPPRTGAVFSPRPHGRSREADADPSAATDEVLGWEGAALMPCPPPERSAVPSPARPYPAPPHVMPGANRSPRLRPFQSPAPGGGEGRKEPTRPGRHLHPAKYGGTAATPRGSGGRRIRVPPTPRTAPRPRKAPTRRCGWRGWGTGDAAPAPARRCPDVCCPALAPMEAAGQ